MDTERLEPAGLNEGARLQHVQCWIAGMEWVVGDVVRARPEEG